MLVGLHLNFPLLPTTNHQFIHLLFFFYLNCTHLLFFPIFLLWFVSIFPFLFSASFHCFYSPSPLTRRVTIYTNAHSKWLPFVLFQNTQTKTKRKTRVQRKVRNVNANSLPSAVQLFLYGDRARVTADKRESLSVTRLTVLVCLLLFLKPPSLYRLPVRNRHTSSTVFFRHPLTSLSLRFTSLRINR